MKYKKNKDLNLYEVNCHEDFIGTLSEIDGIFCWFPEAVGWIDANCLVSIANKLNELNNDS